MGRFVDVRRLDERRLGLVLLGVALLGAGILVRLQLGSKSLWLDEAFSVAMARLPWADFWPALPLMEGNMALYYALLHVWTSVLGFSDGAVRSVSAVAAVASLPFVFLIGRRLFGPVVGGIAALLLGTNAFFIQYAQEARGYALALLLVSAATWLLQRALDEPSRVRWLAYALVAAASFYAHVFTGFVLVAHLTTALMWPGRRLPRVPPFVLVGAITFPMSWFILTREGSVAGWVAPPDTDVVVAALSALAGHQSGALPIAYASLVLVALASWARLFATHRVGRRHVLVAAWAALPILGSLAVSLTVKPVFVDRFLIVALPAVVLLVAVGLVQLRSRFVVVAGVVLMLALSAGGLRYWYADYAKEEWRGAVQHLAAYGQPGDAAVFFPQVVRLAVDHYVRQSGVAERMPRSVVPDRSYGSYFQGLTPESGVADALARDDAPRLWLVYRYGGPTADDWEYAAIQRHLQDGRYRLESHVFLTHIQIMLFTR